jgi:hypothetical protein
MAGSSLLVAATMLSALLIGFFPRLLEGLREPLSKRLGVEDPRVGDLHIWLTLALAPMLVLSGLFIDQWGCQEVMFIGGLLMAGSLATMALTHTYRAVIFGLMTLGAAGACVTTATTLLMPRAFFGDGEPAKSVNLGYVLVGLAALGTPALLDAVRLRLGFRNGTLILALLCLVPAALTALAEPKEFPQPSPTASPADFLASPRLWMIGVVFLLYYPLERSVHTWPNPYLTELEFTPRSIGWLWVGFWGAFLASRLAMALLPPPLDEVWVWVVWVLVILTAVIHGNLIGVYDRSNAGWAFLLLGACFGPIFPTLLGVALELSRPFAQTGDTPASGTALGTLYAIGLMGTLFFQPFMKVFAHTHKVRATMRLPMILGLILGAPLLVLALIR